MIELDQVTLAFSGDILFENVSFKLQKKERLGLVGRNGSGKSTLLKLIIGELEADSGSIFIPKHYKIGHLKQHIQFSQKTLLEEAALGLRDEEKDLLYKAEKILFGLGFSKNDLEKSPQSFSGGYQLRLNLAKVLISEPDCLLLDEPTNYLDIVSIRWLTQFLIRWPSEMILISHDRDFMDQVTTHIMGIHRQSLKKIEGSTLDFFNKILLDEELHEKNRLKSDKKREHLQSFVDRFGAKASKAGQAESKKKLLEKETVLEKLDTLSDLSFKFKEAPFFGKKMLEMENASFSYNEEPLIENFSLEINKNEKIAIIGKNGRGKSTLLKLIGQELKSSHGSSTLSDNTLLGYFGQTHVDRLDASLTIEEELSQSSPNLKFNEVKAIAGCMMFSQDLSSKKISVLSGGEKSRVLLAKIIAKPCNLLLLDEPTHHLDMESIEALVKALEKFTGSFVIVTHSELILKKLKLDKIIICEEAKQTVFLGNYDGFLEKMGWPEEKKEVEPKKDKEPSPTKKSINSRPLERKIETLEKKLQAKALEQKAFETSCEQGVLSDALFQSMATCQKEIEALELELYQLYELI